MLRRATMIGAIVAALALTGAARAATPDLAAARAPASDSLAEKFPWLSELAPADPSQEIVIKPEGKAKGAIMAIHGGGWVGSRDYVNAIPPQVERFAKRGWRVHVVGYRSGVTGLGDLERWYRKIHRSLSPRQPLCAWGASAGSNLALLLAKRHDFDCVIGLGTPTYLPETDEEWDLPGWLHLFARDAFGTELRKYSPLITNRYLRTPTLLGHGRADPTVPIGQARQYMKRVAKVKLIAIDSGGSASFVHIGNKASEPDVDRYLEAEAKLLRVAIERAKDG